VPRYTPIKKNVEARIEANNEKFEVFQGTVVFQMYIHQARTVSIQEEMKGKVDIH
jgi:hypothetical protein